MPMFILASFACHLRYRRELAGSYTFLARGGLTAGLEISRLIASHNFISQLYILHAISLIIRLGRGHLIFVSSVSSSSRNHVSKGVGFQTWSWRFCHLCKESKSFHFNLSPDLVSTWLFNWLCLCFEFQGKTMPPTGQRPAKNNDATQEIGQVFLGLQKSLDTTENQ